MCRKERFRYRVNMYTIKEGRDIEPETFAHLVSSTLYERRSFMSLYFSWIVVYDLQSRFGPFFVEPVVAGLTKASEGSKPYIACTDLIGCLTLPKDFVVSGTASDKLFGIAESLWEPDLVRATDFEPCLRFRR
jgi:20S proteasome subunit beta 3